MSNLIIMSVMPQICISYGNKIMCFDFFLQKMNCCQKNLPYKRSTKNPLGGGIQYKIDFVSYLFFDVYQLTGQVFQLFEIFNN